MSQVIDVKHIQRNIEFLTQKAEEYTELAASYKRQDFETLGNWYESRAAAFEAACEYIQTDIDIFAEEVAQ